MKRDYTILEIIFCLFLIFFLGCKKITNPTITTLDVSDITTNSAKSGGNISDEGGATILSRGICWSINSTPSIADDKTQDGAGAGSFSSIMSGLTPGTRYFVRSYATNKYGTGYGMALSFETSPISLPQITTSEVKNISQNNAVSGGIITSDGGGTITTRGTCWSSESIPTISNPHTNDGSGIGTFTSNLSGLLPNTIYYVRAYATNPSGTSYGNELSFTTLDENEVSDFDGNIYNTITIGTQEWMAENLKTSKLNDGTIIPLVVDNGTWLALNTPGYCFYNNNESENKPIYGALYNWYVVNTGKLCPLGWHVPTDADWSILGTFLGGNNIAGGKLKETGTTHWNSPNTGATNETGFTALPGGLRSFQGMGDYGLWWSSTEYITGFAWCRRLGYIYTDLVKIDVGKNGGLSIRCLKN